MKNFLCLLLILAMAACKNEAEKVKDPVRSMEQKPNLDDTFQMVIPLVKEDYIPGYNSYPDELKTEKTELLKMSIDSTYATIRELSLIRDAINEQSATQLSVVDRNLRSKTLFELNQLENILCRQIDAALLENLKTHTKKLELINEDILAKSEKLATISNKLQRVAGIIDKLSNLLTLCLSRGVVKPATPVAATPT